jgi:ankyrin repeat protein
MNRACSSGDTIAVEMLLKAGADPNGVRDYEAFYQSPYAGIEPSWPINQAAHGGHAKVVRLLLRAGAKAHAPEDEGQTALTIAAEGGHMEVARLLLEAGADRSYRAPGPRGCDGTAEEIARCSGHPEVADAIRDFRSK